MTNSVTNGTLTRQDTGPALWVYLISVVPPILLGVVIAAQPYIDPAELFRDPLSVAHDAAAKGECCHAYYGFVSQLGGLIWAGGSFIAFLAAAVLFSRRNTCKDWRFMAAAGALTSILVVDEVFQGHEFVYPTLFGLSETVVFAIYALLAVAYLWHFRRIIIEVGAGLLIISLTAFATSIMSDLFVSDELSWHRLAEDGSKLLGICTWTAFNWWAAFVLIARTPDT